ncbi:MAG: divalent-cation tolerance protein CutA [Verrucomicrobiales bacterium]|nr:divalent-cation tolerance protein CutA [Verrucomicrobiales bacterium]
MIERQKGSTESVVMVITTMSEAEKARQFGTRLVEMQLVACVNLLPGVESIYQWKGDLEVEGECLVLMKTTRERLGKLEAWVQKNHPYEEPEFLVLPVEAGSAGYFDWVRRQTGS